VQRLRRTGMSIRRCANTRCWPGRPARPWRRAAHRKTVLALIEDLEDSLRLIAGKIDFYGKWLVTGAQPKLPSAQPAASERKSAPRAKAVARAKISTQRPVVPAARARAPARRLPSPAPRAKRDLAYADTLKAAGGRPRCWRSCMVR
jgi:hypothetical protein